MKKSKKLTSPQTRELEEFCDAIYRPGDDAFRRALNDGKDVGEAQEAADAVNDEARRKRGGRPPGKWSKSKGRRADAALCFRVSSEFKAEFERKARASGKSGVAFLKSLVENAPLRD